MKLEVGMYVRTEWGINKIKDIVLNGGLYEDSGLIFENGKLCCGKEAMKELRASNNIIDLIEVGDFISYIYPSGLGILGFEDVKVTEGLLNILQNGENNHEYTIKSIVTKEQFESMQYKVGE